jgi:N-methylhydantoinase A
MAQALGMKQIVIPPSPGLFSSFGLLYAQVEHHYSRTFRGLLRALDLKAAEAAWQQMESEARSQLESEGFSGARARIRREAHLRYQGQTYELTVPVVDGRLGSSSVTAMEEAFGREHERTYGHRAGADEPVELVTLAVVAQGVSESSAVPQRLKPSRGEAQSRPAPRQAYFGPQHGWLETPVLHRGDLATARHGPLIVEEYDATCLVPPQASAVLDTFGNIRIEVAA